MRLKVLLQEIGICETIPGAGEDGIEGHLTGDAVVTVPHVSAIRVCGDDDLRLVEPDQAYELLSEFRSIFKSKIQEKKDRIQSIKI